MALNPPKSERDRLVSELWERYRSELVPEGGHGIAILCPFCLDEDRHGLVVARMEDDGAFHSKPSCSRWSETADASDFLIAVRARLSS